MSTIILTETQILEREKRRKALTTIREAIRALSTKQLELRKILSQPHTEASGPLQSERTYNKMKISALHELSHQSRHGKKCHGKIDQGYMNYVKKELKIE